jgi:hypothetical protein
MADEFRTNPYANLRKDNGVEENDSPRTADYLEETSAEMAAPVTFGRDYDNGRDLNRDRKTDTGTGGTGLGFAAIILSILSLFVAPILFGAAGIVLGFVARRRGAQSLGSWAIGIGVVSIILGIFILPFF